MTGLSLRVPSTVVAAWQEQNVVFGQRGTRQHRTILHGCFAASQLFRRRSRLHTPKQAVRGNAQPQIVVRHGLHAADGTVAQRPRLESARLQRLQLALVAERRRVGRTAALFDDAAARQLPKGLQQFVPLRFGAVPKDEDPAVFGVGGVVGSRRRSRQIVVGIGREQGGGILKGRTNDKKK